MKEEWSLFSFFIQVTNGDCCKLLPALMKWLDFLSPKNGELICLKVKVKLQANRCTHLSLFNLSACVYVP